MHMQFFFSCHHHHHPQRPPRFFSKWLVFRVSPGVLQLLQKLQHHRESLYQVEPGCFHVDFPPSLHELPPFCQISVSRAFGVRHSLQILFRLPSAPGGLSSRGVSGAREANDCCGDAEISKGKAIICLKFWVWLRAGEALYSLPVTDIDVLIPPLTNLFTPQCVVSHCLQIHSQFCSWLENTVLAVGVSDGGVRWILREPFVGVGLST